MPSFLVVNVVGNPLFEYFAPSYVEARKVGGKMVNTREASFYTTMCLSMLRRMRFSV